MKKLAVLFIFACPLFVNGQEMVPDEDSILANIIDPASPYYYPSLMLRYEAGDTTLTLRDYHYLYYGYAYQDSYKPLEKIAGEDRVLSLLEQYPVPDTEQAESIIEAAMRVFRQDPFSPKNINFMAYAYSMAGDSVNAAVNLDRVNKILWVIDNSGSGLKEGSPKHILWFSHANDYLASKDLNIYSRMIRSRSVEYVRLTKKDGNAKGYYFDFGRMYWKQPENPDRNRKPGGFELNGIKLGRNRNTETPAR
ncbi:MAG: DUF4919 domain-containing protein [Rikenellaceae bacterium]|nr:DUF4919 domain-containing protein [Rikenellaceae bacterium]